MEPRDSAGIEFVEGRNGLRKFLVRTATSDAEIYVQGAHVTHFQERGQQPVLFLSEHSKFAGGQPIRGGIPVIFPWFGPRAGDVQHGFARTTTWEVTESATTPQGAASVRLRLPDVLRAFALPPVVVELTVMVEKSLTLELSVTNESRTEPFAFENCLHTYFQIGDISEISIQGLRGATYLDKVAGFAEQVEHQNAIRISSEVDRVFLDTPSAIEILDPVLRRRIRIEKEGSLSTVVWNPWIAKALQMSDFGPEEYKRMVCVESGNVAANAIKLAPGETSRLKVRIGSEPLNT